MGVPPLRQHLALAGFKPAIAAKASGRSGARTTSPGDRHLMNKVIALLFCYLLSGRLPMLVMVACSSTSSITSLAIFMLPAPPAVTGLFSEALLADIVKRVPRIRTVIPNVLTKLCVISQADMRKIPTYSPKRTL